MAYILLTALNVCIFFLGEWSFLCYCYVLDGTGSVTPLRHVLLFLYNGRGRKLGLGETRHGVEENAPRFF